MRFLTLPRARGSMAILIPMTTASLSLDTVLEPRGPACAIILTDAQVAELGGGKRAAVQVTIGDRSAALRIGVMGGENLIGLSKAARAELGVEIGDSVHATVTLEEGPREVEVPAELAEALATDPAARTAYEGLAYSHRKEYAVWVGEAKRPETRARRAAQALSMLAEGRTRS